MPHKNNNNFSQLPASISVSANSKDFTLDFKASFSFVIPLFRLLVYFFDFLLTFNRYKMIIIIIIGVY